MFNPNSGKYEPGWRPKASIPQGMWEDVVDPRTGEHSLRTHKLKVVKQWCHLEGHTFNGDIPRDRKMICTTCGQEITFIVGLYKLVDGHIQIASKNT